MSAIRKNSKDIIFDADMINALNRSSMSGVDKAKLQQRILDPDGSRKRFLNSLIDRPAARINTKNPKILQAIDNLKAVLEHNIALDEKGVDPKNPKGYEQYKKLDPATIAAAMSAFN